MSNKEGRQRGVNAIASQQDGRLKNRPAFVHTPHADFWRLSVMRLNTQLQHFVVDFDDIIETSHADYASSGLKATSLIRLGFLVVLLLIS